MSYSDDFKSSFYGGLDVGYLLNDAINLYVSANSASRIPTFTDLFFVNSQLQGNPLLKPEQSQTIELGTKINKSQLYFTADIYYRMGKNVIDWVKMTSTSAKYEAMNLSSINAFGADISAEYRFKDISIRKVSVAYSYLTLDKTIVGVDSKYALDYLKNKFTINVEHSIFNNLSASWKCSYMERSGSFDANTVLGGTAIIQNYRPYFLLDTRILWADKKFDLFLDVNNILNSSYADYGGLTQPGINFNAGVRLKL